MTDLVDQMFPPIHRRWAAEYTDANYWKTPMLDFPLPDLTPPSPALSARSDTSNQSTLARLRNFSLAGRARSPPRMAQVAERVVAEDRVLREERNAEGSSSGGERSMHLRQMSSFERLGQTLGLVGSQGEGASTSISKSASPSASSTAIDSGDESDEEVGWDGKRRERRRSISSMPGSLPGSDEDMQFGVDEDEEAEEGYGGYEDGEEDGEEADDHADETFDEDLLAAGEMAQVPFL
jgi:phosphatidate phosphatase LPIN